jgi:hypothetical protein
MYDALQHGRFVTIAGIFRAKPFLSGSSPALLIMSLSDIFSDSRKRKNLSLAEMPFTVNSALPFAQSIADISAITQ